MVQGIQLVRLQKFEERNQIFSEQLEKIEEQVQKIRTIYYEDIEGTTFSEKMANLHVKATLENTCFAVSLPAYEKIYVEEDEIVIDAYKVFIAEGNGAEIIYTGSVINNHFIRITNSVIARTKRRFKDFYVWVNGNVSIKKNGLLFGGSDCAGTSNLTFENVNVERFYPAHNFISNAYLITFRDCALIGGIRMETSYSNYGENISYDKCILYNTTAFGEEYPSVYIHNSNGDFRFTNCSFDYSAKIIEAKAGGVIISNSHLEFRLSGQNDKLYNYPAITVEGGNTIVSIKDSRFLGELNSVTPSIPNTTNRPYIATVDGGDWNSASRALLRIRDCEMFGMETTTGEFCGGNSNGIFEIEGSHSNTFWNVPLVSKKNNNARSKFIVEPLNCTTSLISESVNGIVRNDVIEFTVTNSGPRAFLKFYTKQSVSYKLWFKGLSNKDSYTLQKFKNDPVASPATINANSGNWQSLTSSRYIKPTNSNNFLEIELNRAVYNVGEKFYVYVEEIYEW